MIIIGSTYRIERVLGIDITDAESTDFIIQYNETDEVKAEYTATVSTASNGTIYVDVPADENDELGSFKVWVKVVLPDDVIYKFSAKLITVYPEGTIE
jgi:hypothetical protein